MAGIMGYFGGRRDAKQSSRDAIVTLRQQLQLIDKKEEYLQKKIDEEMKKARANAVTNKQAATAALRRKKATEQELERLQGTRFQLEMQVNTLESASFNAETMAAMKKASGALKDIHGKLTIDRVDTTMAEIQDQTQLANEVSEAISANTYSGIDIDEDELKAELAGLEDEELDKRLMGADHVPVHQPGGPSRVEERPTAVEDDEEAQLRELQAALAM
ncbi:Snf7-domain-containing protein [Fomitopsis serialis]|uniref:Snf7-domain-containing protein n=1 Tax=Fomitopsis serialis TaxID=139415 RepID=UPI0020087A6F|nr:Snf7-domain-containing protein [Neoantrodia serialis]KAH9938322.1 Snf7-domain-containing protein [Neoantrodia serialis]